MRRCHQTHPPQRGASRATRRRSPPAPRAGRCPSQCRAAAATGRPAAPSQSLAGAGQTGRGPPAGCRAPSRRASCPGGPEGQHRQPCTPQSSRVRQSTRHRPTRRTTAQSQSGCRRRSPPTRAPKSPRPSRPAPHRRPPGRQSCKAGRKCPSPLSGSWPYAGQRGQPGQEQQAAGALGRAAPIGGCHDGSASGRPSGRRTER